MLLVTSRRCLGAIFNIPISSPNAVTLPSFLLPAFHQSSSRSFSSSPKCQSKIGKAALTIPPGVTFQVLEPMQVKVGRVGRSQPMSTVHVKGPKGEMSMPIPPFIAINQTDPNAPTLSILNEEDRKQREMWGTVRAYLQNHILGVSEGHTAILRLVGVGYRATIEEKAVTKQPEYPGQKFVNLKVGYSHPIELGLPKGVTASTPQPTRILLKGIEREVVMQFAAKIRMWRKPEPYKGKGIFVNGETIKLKSKKIK
ncbi:mitochondrial 54S ribosomal protein YmL16 [Patellaria atrata CBS 101060]|uniref:Mitochondrial 54S ribosomal protein YmL16 n=1 Tax=Patellaria atrata CBS 101060 TaxID=1346257 RepID=A0A9P4S7S1_9PEZI|nr:mitochondrial 54S ribosomal protein YmL16 [Patellaria atrata CBS 101060]